MGLLNITDIASNSQATANSINTRIGKILGVINGNIEAANIKAASITKSCLATDVLEAVYPVGSIYINAQNNTNPATLLGFGTWEAFAAGKVMVGIDTTQTEFDTVGETGGENTHTLTTAELPVHNHGTLSGLPNQAGGWISGSGTDRYLINNSAAAYGGYGLTGTLTTNAGSGTAHNNLQPYVVVYCWKRVG